MLKSSFIECAHHHKPKAHYLRLERTHLQSPTVRLLTRSPFCWRYFVNVPVYRTGNLGPYAHFCKFFVLKTFVLCKTSDFDQQNLIVLQGSLTKWNSARSTEYRRIAESLLKFCIIHIWLWDFSHAQGFLHGWYLQYLQRKLFTEEFAIFLTKSHILFFVDGICAVSFFKLLSTSPPCQHISQLLRRRGHSLYRYAYRLLHSTLLISVGL